MAHGSRYGHALPDGAKVIVAAPNETNGAETLALAKAGSLTAHS
ncbi:MAG: hypothetical protein QOJ15_11355 [Bradyrhizobium sp.]|jgi:hypothetical protein|nr:hypothetical protein [Bradyrhizobium sp.]